MKKTQTDPYSEAVCELYDHMLQLFRTFADKRPVIHYEAELFLISRPSQRHAQPMAGFAAAPMHSNRKSPI